MRILDASLRPGTYVTVGAGLLLAALTVATTGVLWVSGTGLVLWMSCGAILMTLALSGQRDGPAVSDVQGGTPAELVALASTTVAMVAALRYADVTSTLVLAGAALALVIATCFVAGDGFERDRSRRHASRRLAGWHRRDQDETQR